MHRKKQLYCPKIFLKFYFTSAVAVSLNGDALVSGNHKIGLWYFSVLRCWRRFELYECFLVNCFGITAALDRQVSER